MGAVEHGLTMPTSPPYDPTSEPTNAEKVAAANWECLRRNPKFQDVARQWMASEEFRHQHSLTTDYHHSKTHFPRCALDWMLTPSQRVELFRYQVSHLHIYTDTRFNFGAIVQQQKIETQHLRRQAIPDFITAGPLPNAPRPLKLDDTWRSAPEEFRAQFRFVIAQPEELQDLTSAIRQRADPLRIMAQKVAAGDPMNEAQLMARDLQWLGDQFHDFGEFYKVIAIPNGVYTTRSIDEVLEKIRAIFANAKQIVPYKKYNLHKSYYGTTEDWRWFLEAESRGLDKKKQPDLYKLAEIYSEHLKQLPAAARRRNVQTVGFRGEKVPSRLLKSRRATILKHLDSIQKWIDDIYPPPAPTK